ncbi:MOSC-domain-containing protein [Aspergillus steynii IBT 23096]|uniref:MOSC-domain-containing protein n=1 Tax=Aspergillus steynii IBT 23096 TaxID=1392250 RepID=A0A2I2GRA4_9EURO|nr:MOSC-domain-containing protein [Aspergillus steynii IBT 23096]PLB55415.1 MOSC-domain-containing protein [Aspergillus steynii IBT 23096]
MLDSISPVSAVILLLLLAAPVLIIPRFSSGPALSNTSSLLRRLRGSRQPPSEVVSLRVYPIKSCRGIELTKTKLRMHGLDLDRRWMFVDAKTNEFLTIRQIPQMTLINTALDTADETSPDADGDTDTLVLSITGVQGTVRIPAYPSPSWLAAHTTLAQVKIWDTVTDGHVYGAAVNDLFSSFLARDVCLVYKGPTPRVLQGNGDPRLLGRTQSTNFPDVHPVLIASEASIAELNGRLQESGADPITIERFRPNIIIRGSTPWTEDSWKLVRISGASSSSSSLVIDVVARCARCQVPNVNPDTADKHKTQPWNTLMKYRRIDEGITYKPCFGMLSAPRNEGAIEVGMKFEVLEETRNHRYVKGF